MLIADLTADSMQTLPPTGSTKNPRSVICFCKRCRNIFPSNHPALACEVYLFLTFRHSQQQVVRSGTVCSGFPCELHSVLLTVMEEEEHHPMRWPSSKKVLQRFAPFGTMETPFLVRSLYNPGSSPSVFLAAIYKFGYG